MDRMTQGYAEGERIAWLSVWTLVNIGIFEIGTGFFTNSIGLTADGVDSLSDAVISFVVWLGLRFSRRRPDRYFHFGYHKVESLGAFIASIGMIAVASFILYNGYLALLHPRELNYPALALAALLIAGSVSLYRAFQMRRIARTYGLLSLQTDANNSIKDGTASFLVFASVAAATLGFPWMDAVGAIIIAVYIYTVSYVAIREAGLILLDAFSAPEVLAEVRKLIQTIPEVRAIPDIKLRHSGPFITGRVGIALDSHLSVGAAHEVVRRVEAVLTQRIEGLRDFVVHTVPFNPAAENPQAPSASELRGG